MDQEQNNSQQPQNSQVFKVRGMKTDFSESSFENSYAFENKNMRINIVDEDNTLLNLTNERGTKEVCEFDGIPVCLKKYNQNNALLVTTTNEGGIEIEILKNEIGQSVLFEEYNDIDIEPYKDRVYNIVADGDNVKCDLLYEFDNTDTNLSAHDPLEIEHYNDSTKDLFYAVDGINNLKAFGIEKGEIISNNNRLEYNDYISGNEKIAVGQTYSTIGEFFSGAMIYCFAYTNKLGHKTGIIDFSDVVYLTNYSSNASKRIGVEPNKRCNIANTIKITGLSRNFKSVEIYSLYRSSLDGDIVCKKVAVQKITENSNVVSCQDLNKGESISYQELLSRFNQILNPYTITQKNSALFIGNIKTNNFDNLKYVLDSISVKGSVNFLKHNNDKFLSSNQYFFGIQFQDKFGNWTPALSVGGSKGSVDQIRISVNIIRNAMEHGYIAIRAMMLDNMRIRNSICEGVSMPVLSFEKAKYGIDYYSPYFYMPKSKVDNNSFSFDSDIYRYSNENRFRKESKYSDIYSPDIEFNENLIINTNDDFHVHASDIVYEKLSSHKIDIEINGNIGTLYNSDSANNLGKSEIDSNNGLYIWNDSIVGYQKALQLLFWDSDGSGNISGDDMFLSLYKLGEMSFYEKPTKYVIYTWQPSGSLNDSKENISLLKSKRISRKYNISSVDINTVDKTNRKCYVFDGSNNNIPLEGLDVYGGNINHTVYPSSWKIDESYRVNKIGDAPMWDDDQIEKCDCYALATLPIYSFIGQPIEVVRKIDGRRNMYMCSALGKIFEDEFLFTQHIKIFRGENNTSLGAIYFNNYKSQNGVNYLDTVINPNNSLGITSKRRDYIINYEQTPEVDNKSTGYKKWLNYPIKVRATNNFNRSGNIHIAYNTAKHIIYRSGTTNNKYVRLERVCNDVNISKSDIETGSWIVCSKKQKLKADDDLILSVDINEKFVWESYECLKTEPHSMNDENQVTCCLAVKNINSYINPLCRYDKLRDMSDYNGVTSSMFNKLNMVYNQKNNFFVFPGITSETITSDNQSSTIMYSDTKVHNEDEDTFLNFNINNFFDLDNNVNKINKLITYNDKLLCMSDNSIVNILYNENIVINTDAVQNLGLASSDKISGTQLISSFGCLNKWSVGITNNTLYFNDDINNKIMSYSSDGFSVLNETLGIETLNSKILKRSIWNPADFCNTKINIDKYSKDIHYTTRDMDISLNTAIGSFMSIMSYDNVSYMEQIGNHSIAIRGNKLYALREGDYNYFFGKYEPYWTTVIMNNNSLTNKTLSNIEFNTESYRGLVPDQNFTFDTVEFWNDYQSNSIKVDWKMYGQSLLKKKFRIWRVNMLRDSSRIYKRNTDMISNPWTYMKLLCNTENTNKLTLHWININYK